jgi:hypothetical protein
MPRTLTTVLATAFAASVVVSSVDPSSTSASTVPVAVAPPVAPPGGGERAFVAGAVRMTDLTAAQATALFRTNPELAAKVPVTVTDEHGVRSVPVVPSAGVESRTAAGTTRSRYAWRACWVWTRRRVKNWLGMTLFSFTMAQKWLYDGVRVLPYRPTVDYDVTSLGFIWYWSGVVLAEGAYHRIGSGSEYSAHRSRRTGQFKTQEWNGGWTYNVDLFIDKLYNGDWVSTTGFGLPGCRNA